MNLLVFIILILFKVYIKNINHLLYFVVISMVLLSHEIYNYKRESFFSKENLNLDYLSESALCNINKRKCIYDKQKENLVSQELSECHKINNRELCNDSCSRFIDEINCNNNIKCSFDKDLNECKNKKSYNCKYDEQINKCIDNDKCQQKKCDDICYIHNKYECNDYKKYNDTCLNYDSKNKCNSDKNCKWKIYNDVYYTEQDTDTMVGCFNILNLENFYLEKFDNISLTELKNKRIEGYYGYIKHLYKENGTGYILTNSHYSDLQKRKIDNDKCVFNNAYLGNRYNMVVYKYNEPHLIGCYDLDAIKSHIQINSVDNNNYILRNITLDKLNEFLENETNINYYGIIKNNDSDLVSGYFFNDSVKNSLNNKINNLKCVNNNKYIGKDTNIVLFKKKGQCNNNYTICNWENKDSTKCYNIKKNECNKNENCIFDYNKNKCINKGYCYDKCENKNEKNECLSILDNFTDESKCSWVNGNCKNKIFYEKCNNCKNYDKCYECLSKGMDYCNDSQTCVNRGRFACQSETSQITNSDEEWASSYRNNKC